MIRRPHVPRVHLPSTWYLYSSSSYCCRCSLHQAGTPIVLLYEEGDAVRIEPRPSSPSTRRLCARSSRRLFRPQASGEDAWIQSVLGESGASCRLSINNTRGGSNSGSQQQQYEELVDNSGRWLTHPPLRTPPMPHQKFLAEGRASVGLYTTASVCVRSS